MSLDSFFEKLSTIEMEDDDLKTVVDMDLNYPGDEWPMRFIDGKPRSHDPFKDIVIPKRSLFDMKRKLALKAYYGHNQ